MGASWGGETREVEGGLVTQWCGEESEQWRRFLEGFDRLTPFKY